MSERVVLHFDDGSKIDFNTEADALRHLTIQGLAGAESLHEESSPEEEQQARLEAQLKALKGGEPATGDPYRVELEPLRGKKLRTRAQLEKALKNVTVEEES